MPNIDLSILNQRQTPSFYASSLATRPAFGFAGRIFIDTDSPSTGLYRDTGAAWVQIADPGAGTTGTLQQVTTNGNSTSVGLVVTAGTFSTVPDLIYNTGNGVDWLIKNIPNGPLLRLKAHGTQGGYANRRGALGWKDNNGVNVDIVAWDETTTTFYTPTYYPITQGSVLFAGASGLLDQDNANFFWDKVNGHLGVNTNVPGTALDVHHDQPTVAILNQTVATNDVRIGFQNNGVGLWRIGSFYNAGANDFGIYDAVAAIQPVTVKKTTGQVLIGTSTVGSGKLVVASTTGDNGIQIVGATAPSLRIDSAESGPTKRAGFGISTATNNFIQGSADRDFCMFNGSTTASPILFGIYDTTNVQEAARISAARNFLIGGTTDGGQKLQVTGTSYIDGAAFFNSTLETRGNVKTLINSTTGVPTIYTENNVGSITQLRTFGTSAPGTLFGITRAGYSSFDSNNGLGLLFGTTDTSPIIIGTSNTERMRIAADGTKYFGSQTSRFQMSASGENFYQYTNTFYIYGLYNSSNNLAIESAFSGDIEFRAQNQTISSVPQTATIRATIKGNTGNLLIGTTTDSGYKLSVNGSSYLNGLIVQGGGIYGATGQFVLGGGATASFYTFSNSATNQVYLITVRQAGNGVNSVIGMCTVYAGGAACYNIAQDNTNPVIQLTLGISGLSLQLSTGAGYGTTTWEYTITILKN